jgi:hypothetical protein
MLHRIRQLTSPSNPAAPRVQLSFHPLLAPFFAVLSLSAPAASAAPPSLQRDSSVELAEAQAALAVTLRQCALQKAKAEAVIADCRAKSASRALLNAKISTFLRRGCAGLALCGALYLAYGYVTHSYRPFLRWQMKRLMRAGSTDSQHPLHHLLSPAEALPVAPLPAVRTGQPLLLLGPGGSGMTSTLSRLACDLQARGVPVAYARLYGLSRDGHRGSGRFANSSIGRSMTAEALLRGIGYSPCQSTLYGLWVLLYGADGSTARAAAALGRSSEKINGWHWMDLLHLHYALEDLFTVCEELHQERSWCSPEDRAPVILLDGLSDLLCTEEPASTHATLRQHVLEHFAAEASSRCMGGGATVRLCASAWTLEQHRQLSCGGALQLHPVLTPDPPVEAVLQWLRAAGYAQEQAEQIVHTCGTRLGLLAHFIHTGPKSKEEVATTLWQLVSSAHNSLRSLLHSLNGNPAAQQALVALLDRLCTGGQPPVPLASLPLQLRRVPGLLTGLDCLLCTPQGDIELQSRPHAIAWAEGRKRGDFGRVEGLVDQV